MQQQQPWPFCKELVSYGNIFVLHVLTSATANVINVNILVPQELVFRYTFHLARRYFASCRAIKGSLPKISFQSSISSDGVLAESFRNDSKHLSE